MHSITSGGDPMNPEELRVRKDLTLLAASPRGRELLQLALRSINRGERGLTAGCWTDRGIAGCLFQHAYWQGVDEGVFADAGRPGDWIGSFVGSGDYGIVIRAIESFDLLAKHRFADVVRRRMLPDRIEVRQDEWRSAVERILVETLAGPAPAEPVQQEVTAST
jgi:hypothetical protein